MIIYKQPRRAVMQVADIWVNLYKDSMGIKSIKYAGDGWIYRPQSPAKGRYLTKLFGGEFVATCLPSGEFTLFAEQFGVTGDVVRRVCKRNLQWTPGGYPLGIGCRVMRLEPNGNSIECFVFPGKIKGVFNETN